MSQDKEFKHESIQDNQSIIGYLEALRDGFVSGNMVFATRVSDMELHPGGMIKLEVEAKKKGPHRKLALKFTWREGAEEPAQDESFSIEPR